MATARQLMDRARDRILQNPAAASELNAVYKFVLSGADGGTWTFHLKGSPEVREEDATAECVLRMSAEDYVAMQEGREDAQALFFAQRLQIEGDIGLALKLQSLNQLIG
jgi:putative sterol carrier protein